MKSPSLDILYVGLDRHIRLVESYVGTPGLDFVIRACRLKPYSYIFEKKDPRVFLYRKWFDEFGNLLHIQNDRAITITHNDLSLERTKIICTDLYFGLSVRDVAKISKLVYVCSGKNELTREFIFLTFLGIDNYLRSYFYDHGEWQQISPLLLGLHNLLTMAEHRDVEYYTHQENKESPIPCLSAQSWMSRLPPGQSFLTSIHKQCDIVDDIFRGVFDGK